LLAGGAFWYHFRSILERGSRPMDIQCPHCRSPIQLGALPSEEVVCPACGSSFRLEAGNTTRLTASAGLSTLGRFQLLETLGAGGFGTVYKARDPELDRLVAVKVPRETNVGQGEPLERFLREARSVAQLRHPNIVSVHEVGQSGPLPYLVSEYVPGVSLADWLTAHRPTYRQAAELVALLAEAIQYAHDHGVIHRDIKPANILLEPAPPAGNGNAGATLPGIPRLMDFGMAKRDAGEVTMTVDGQVLGTPAYMSPEQAQGESHRVDGRSDVYSLGVVFYELLTGELPFRGNVRMLLHQVLRDEPRPPRKVDDRIPRDLETVCLKAMAKEPERRYQAAGELAGDLRRFLQGEPVRARPVGGAERLRRWCARNPTVAALTTAVAIALLAGTGVSCYFAVKAGAQAEQAVANAGRAEQETGKARQAEGKAQRLATDLALDKGLALCDGGDTGLGMLWLAHCLELAPGDAEHARWLARMNLAGWRHSLNALLMSEQVEVKGPLPSFAMEGSGLTALRFNAAVNAVALSPDGSLAAAACGDGTVRLWRTADGESLHPPLTHTGPALAVTFSPDGRLLLTGSFDRTAVLWDVATGRPIGGPLRHSQPVTYVRFGPGGRVVLTGTAGGSVHLWEAASGRALAQPLPHPGKVLAAAFSPDDRRLLTAGEDQTARLWECVPGTPAGQVLQHRQPVTAVAFAPDGQRCVTASADRIFRWWDPAAGKLLRESGQLEGEFAVADLSPDGRVAVTQHRGLEGGGEGTQLCDTKTTAPIGPPLPMTAYWTASWAFSPDSGVFLIPEFGATARLWDTARGRAVGQPLLHTATAVGAMSLSRDGRRAITATAAGEVRVWEVSGPQPGDRTLPHNDAVTTVAFAPDGRTFVTGTIGGAIQFWDALTATRLGEPVRHDGNAWSMMFGPGAKILATAGMGQVQLWDVATRRPLGKPFHHPSAACVDISADGRLAVSGGLDGTAQLWEMATGNPLGTRLRPDSTNWVAAVAFSPDGSAFATAGTGVMVHLWDTATRQPLGGPLQVGTPMRTLAFSQDGKQLVTGDMDGVVRAWDLATREATGWSVTNDRSVRKVLFTPDGKVLMTTGDGRTARFWDWATGTRIGPPLRHAGQVRSAAISPDGHVLLTGGYDRAAHLWPVPAPVEGDVERVMLWVQVLTGLELDDRGGARVLDNQTWLERRQRLQALGGPPPRPALPGTAR
jgi:WD40 repeat protein/tRNA A-37 threonylcarbamoyl transferase component Bud32